MVIVPALLARQLPRGDVLMFWVPFWAFCGLLICYVSGDYVVRETLVVAGGKLRRIDFPRTPLNRPIGHSPRGLFAGLPHARAAQAHASRE